MLAQPFVTVLAAPPHMRGPMLPILPDSCFPGYRTGAFGAPEYSEGMNITDSMRRAACASAIACTRKGAAPSIPSQNEVLY